MKLNTDLVQRHILKAEVPGPKVLLLAGVHGDEYEPIVAAGKLVQQLKGHLTKGSVTIVPNSNPGAYQAASRYGDDGLDMARICPGSSGGTSSERAADEVGALIRNCDYLVDMHTGGVMYDIYPLVGYMLHADPAVLECQRQMARCYNYPVIWGTDPLPEGRTLSVARDAHVPAIYLEHGGGIGFRQDVVDAYANGFFNLLRWLEMIPGQSVPVDIGRTYWVEDARPDSGFLQGKMPSPVDGIFISKATLGHPIKKGDTWGEILNPETNEATEVLADIDGLAFLMRNIVKVRKGDALGGILPINEPGKVVIENLP